MKKRFYLSLIALDYKKPERPIYGNWYPSFQCNPDGLISAKDLEEFKNFVMNYLNTIFKSVLEINSVTIISIFEIAPAPLPPKRSKPKMKKGKK